MNVQISIVPSIPDTTPKRTLIRWDNPIAIEDGYCTDIRRNPATGELVGQFAMCPVYLTDMQGVWVKSWAENSLATLLTPSDLQRIATLQSADIVNGVAYTVKQKMGWLCADSVLNGWGSPINTRGEDYTIATNIKMITAVYAGQPVKLTGETMTRPIELNGKSNFELLHRVTAYNPSQWMRENSMLVTAVSKSNVYTENTKGRIVLPVWFGSERKAYILDRWLEKQ
jgi:hypothetical protein